MRLHAVVADLATARAAVAGGATAVQLRLKGAPTAEIVDAGGPFRELCSRLGVTFVVNDDIDAARRLGADFVHVGRKDLERLGGAPDWPFGLSAATPGEALTAERLGAAYVGAGPVWETPTKTDGDPAIGLGGLRAIVEAVSLPVVAIGGIDATGARACIEAGAAGVAVVRAASDSGAVRAEVDAGLEARAPASRP